MTTLVERLRSCTESIVGRWLEAIWSTYPEEASVAFGREKDRFANPVGHRMREGAGGLFAALLDDGPADRVRSELKSIIEIRAVQALSASEAVGFVFGLKAAIRSELDPAVTDSRWSAEWLALEDRIDRMALVAFDVFVECREQVCELRVAEVKRRVSWIVEKMSGRDPALARVLE